MDAVVLYPPIGTSQDAPDENGSLHAKIAELREYIDTQLATVQKPRAVHGASGAFSTNQCDYQTALSVTGKGRLTHLALATTTAITAYVKLTLDGNVIALGSAQDTGGKRHYPTADFPFTMVEVTTPPNFDAEGSPTNAEFVYKTSLKIELRAHSVNHNVIVYWLYEHE